MTSAAFRRNYKLIKWAPIKSAEPKRDERRVAGPHFMPDIAEFVSPINFEPITSRSQLREHEKRHEVRQCGELRHSADFDNKRLKPQAVRERALETAYRKALSQVVGD